MLTAANRSSYGTGNRHRRGPERNPTRQVGTFDLYAIFDGKAEKRKRDRALANRAKLKGAFFDLLYSDEEAVLLGFDLAREMLQDYRRAFPSAYRWVEPKPRVPQGKYWTTLNTGDWRIKRRIK